MSGTYSKNNMMAALNTISTHPSYNQWIPIILTKCLGISAHFPFVCNEHDRCATLKISLMPLNVHTYIRLKALSLNKYNSLIILVYKISRTHGHYPILWIIYHRTCLDPRALWHALRCRYRMAVRRHDKNDLGKICAHTYIHEKKCKNK